MSPADFLALIPHECIRTSRGEQVELFRLGTFCDEAIELACLKMGVYRPHIHDRATSIIRIVSGIGMIILNGQRGAYMPGSVFDVPAGTAHGFEVFEPTILLTTLDAPIKNPSTGAFDFRYVHEPVA